MADAQFVLALDSGSQSSRALLFDAKGTVLANGSHAHAAMRHPEPGAVEQDPIDIRDCLFGAIRDCLQAWGGDPAAIAGVSLTTQRTTVLLAAADGTPLIDAVSWLDRRTAGLDSEPKTALRLLLKAMGPNALLPRLLAKSWPRQWRERDPETLARAAWMSPIEGWLNHQLTGRNAVAPGGLAGAWPFDVKKRAWSKPGLLYTLLAYEPRWLPDIVEAGQRIGAVTAAAAGRTGLVAGTPVFACGGDKQAEALGAGVRGEQRNVGAVSLGSGSSICIPSLKPLASMNYHWLTMAGCEPGLWYLEYLLFRGMWTARWFARELGKDLEAEAARSGRPAEAYLCDEAEAVPAGANGLVTWPRWSPTLQHPMETGTCVGLRETHTRGHFFRALLEGIGFDLRRGREILEKAAGVNIAEVRVGGGGSRSSVVVGILADILGVPIVRPPSEELAARGAAIVAAVGSRLYPSYDAAVSAMVPAAETVRPDAKRMALYSRIYREVYLPGLDAVRKLSGRLVVPHE
ncbi:MAG: hypothetical protein GX444_06845 [Myxococcales bacterium]|nr:hypothetical protein [Myxococcales bacterium]